MHLLSSLSWLAIGANALSMRDTSKFEAEAEVDIAVGTKPGSHKVTGIGAGKAMLGYYGNWDIYGAKYNVTDIPADRFTHLSYAFGDINNQTGEVILSDPHADIELAYPGDDTKAKGKNVYGNLKQLFILKQKYRNLKTMFAIGGWTYSPKYTIVLASAAKREAFAKSAVQIVRNFGFDGVDVDYEYVNGTQEAENMVDLLQRLRAGLDMLQQETKATVPFLLSFCAPAGKSHYTQLDFAKMTPLLDWYNVMALDYMGPGFSNNSGYLDNVYLDKKNPNATDFDTQSALHYYLHKGKVPSSKILLQNPLYGRAFNGTAGIGKPFKNGGTIGSLGTAGVWYYKDLPPPGFDLKVTNDRTVIGSYGYDARKEYLVSYDTPEIARLKVEYANHMKLGGIAFWEVSQDRNDSLSLIDTTFKAYGGPSALQKRENNLKYPTSIYDNIRAGLK